MLLFLVYTMSAFTVDISQHLENSVKFLKIGPGPDDVLTVDDSKNTALKIQELLNKGDSLENIDKAIEIAMGKEALKKLNKMNLSMEAYKNVFIGMMACISSLPFEEMEKQFRQSK